MRCPNCRFENPEGTKFCEECGTKLVRACPSCGHEVRPTAKFCGECGTTLPGQSGVRSRQHSTPSPQAEAEAEVCFHKTIEIARRQQAKSLELRAVMSLTRLWQSQGKTEEAHRMLAEIYGWFTEGFDTTDLQEAKALLEGLTWEKDH